MPLLTSVAMMHATRLLRVKMLWPLCSSAVVAARASAMATKSEGATCSTASQGVTWGSGAGPCEDALLEPHASTKASLLQVPYLCVPVSAHCMEHWAHMPAHKVMQGSSSWQVLLPAA
jgi:hypothetical protein